MFSVIGTAPTTVGIGLDDGELDFEPRSTDTGQAVTVLRRYESGNPLHLVATGTFLDGEDRLLTPSNSNGFMPGEAGGALLVGRPERRAELLMHRNRLCCREGAHRLRRAAAGRRPDVSDQGCTRRCRLRAARPRLPNNRHLRRAVLLQGGRPRPLTNPQAAEGGVRHLAPRRIHRRDWRRLRHCHPCRLGRRLPKGVLSRPPHPSHCANDSGRRSAAILRFGGA